MRRTGTMLGIASIALTASALTGASSATATPDGPGPSGSADRGKAEPVVQGQSGAIQLNGKQEKALQQAWEADPELTFKEVLTAIGEKAPIMTRAEGAKGNSSTAPGEGEGEVTADCSSMTLWGDSDGNWRWTNKFFRLLAGPALAGSAQVSTNGELSVASNFGFEGLKQSEEGQVPFEGFFATRTQVRAWSWNDSPKDGPKVCFGLLHVWWE